MKIDRDALEDMAMVTLTEAVVDPDTLRPVWAAYRRTVSLPLAGRVSERVERRDYWFDWPTK